MVNNDVPTTQLGAEISARLIGNTTVDLNTQVADVAHGKKPINRPGSQSSL